MRRRLGMLLALAVLAVLVISGYLLDRFSPTYREFFSWPQGSVWSNAIEQVLAIIVGFILGIMAREPIGRRIGKWLHKHNPLKETIEAMHEIVADVYVSVNGGDEHPRAPERRTSD